MPGRAFQAYVRGNWQNQGFVRTFVPFYLEPEKRRDAERREMPSLKRAIKASLCWIIRAKKSSGCLLPSGQGLLADPTETAFVGQHQLQREVSRSFHYKTSCNRHWGMNPDFLLLLYYGVFHLNLQLFGSNPGPECKSVWEQHGLRVGSWGCGIFWVFVDEMGGSCISEVNTQMWLFITLMTGEVSSEMNVHSKKVTSQQSNHLPLNVLRQPLLL